MSPQRAKARHLYFSDNKTQKEIATIVGVSEKTIYNWIQYYSWHKLREAAISAPAMIADNICSQIVDFQKVIAKRHEEERAPTAAEINLQHKLSSTLDKFKKYPNKGQTMQALMSFIYFVGDDDESLAELLFEKYDQYMAIKSQDGYKPYQFEAGRNPFVFTPLPDYPDACQPEPVEGQPNPACQHEPVEGLPACPAPFCGEPVEGQPVKSSNQSVKTSNEPATKLPEIPAVINRQTELEDAPITLQDFNDYKHMLSNFGKLFDHTQVSFRGKQVNAKWLQYNLLQYTLPPNEQRFLTEPRDVLSLINYSDTYLKIGQYLSAQRKAAA